jgi:hypothetical protein
MSKKLTQEEAIKRCREAHFPINYVCDKTKYIGSDQKMIFNCINHGDFRQNYTVHVYHKGGCPQCGKEKSALSKTLTQEESLKRCREVHFPINYTCSKTIYKSAYQKMTFHCINHGYFQQTYTDHVYQKSGCPQCALENHPGYYNNKIFDQQPEIKNIPAIYYTFKLSSVSETFIKKGITIRTTKKRANRIPYTVEVLNEEKMTLFEAFTKEQKEKEKYKHLKYGPEIYFGGHTECFTLEILKED